MFPYIENYYRDRKKLDTLIVETYNEISKYYDKFLKNANVKLPKLKKSPLNKVMHNVAYIIACFLLNFESLSINVLN